MYCVYHVWYKHWYTSNSGFCFNYFCYFESSIKFSLRLGIELTVMTLFKAIELQYVWIVLHVTLLIKIQCTVFYLMCKEKLSKPAIGWFNFKKCCRVLWTVNKWKITRDWKLERLGLFPLELYFFPSQKIKLQIGILLVKSEELRGRYCWLFVC